MMGLRRRLGVIGAVATIVVLALFAGSWWLDPARTSIIFGIPLTGTHVAFGRVKGAEDLLAAVVLLLFACRRDHAALSAVLFISLLVPVGDMVALLLAGIDHEVEIAIHVVFILWMSASAILLRRRVPRPPIPAS
jgi:hypothetical protein